MNNEDLLFMMAIEGKYFYMSKPNLLILQTNVKLQYFTLLAPRCVLIIIYIERDSKHRENVWPHIALCI